jgi:polysaccharide biosynthesis transport protein
LLPRNLFFGRKLASLKNYPNLGAFEKPDFLEAYLQLRTHLLLSTSGTPPKSILITSSEEGEGKTLTALNLAASLSKTGNKVLLIDADLRCPRVHIVKELQNENGLTTLLTVNEADDGALEKIIQKEDYSNLHFLTAGKKAENPANLLCSEEMRELLSKLATKYDFIIIDSSPTLYFADSTILATLTDSVLMVVRDNMSSKQAVLKAKKLLNSVGARIIGMVLNAIPRKRSNYSKYRYYEAEREVLSESEYQTLKLN